MGALSRVIEDVENETSVQCDSKSLREREQGVGYSERSGQETASGESRKYVVDARDNWELIVRVN